MNGRLNNLKINEALSIYSKIVHACPGSTSYVILIGIITSSFANIQINTKDK